MTRPPPSPSLQTSPARLRGAGGGWLGDTPLLVLSAAAPTTTTASFFITRTYFRSTILPILSSPFSPRYGNGHAPPGLHRRRRPRLPESPSWVFQIFSFRFGFSLVVLNSSDLCIYRLFLFYWKVRFFFFLVAEVNGRVVVVRSRAGWARGEKACRRVDCGTRSFIPKAVAVSLQFCVLMIPPRLRPS